MKLFNKRKLKIWMIFLCTVMAVRFLPAQTKAAEGDDKFSSIADFTDIALWYASESGEPDRKIEDRALLVKDAKLALRYDYEIAEDRIKTIVADTAYYLEVSPHLVLPDLRDGSPLTVKIEGEEPVEFGKICADGARAWVIFEANADGSSTVLAEVLADTGDFEGAYFYLQCSRAGELPENASPIEGEDNLYALKYENNKELLFGYRELERTEARAKIAKNGSLQDKTFTWTISYTPWQNPDLDGPDSITGDTPFELRDRIEGTMHSYVAGSLKIDGIEVHEYASGDLVPEDAETYAVLENSESGTVLNIGGRKLCAGSAPAGTPPGADGNHIRDSSQRESPLAGQCGKAEDQQYSGTSGPKRRNISRAGNQRKLRNDGGAACVAPKSRKYNA